MFFGVAQHESDSYFGNALCWSIVSRMTRSDSVCDSATDESCLFAFLTWMGLARFQHTCAHKNMLMSNT